MQDDGAYKGNEARPSRGTPAEVFAVFLKLGLTSFGGPIAHLGYFRDELVTRRQWLGDAAYADLVALCQFLPGPASSQVGFALGMMRAGWLGALAAFAAFTAPSALALLFFAMTATGVSGPVGAGALHGLKIVAVAIVAQAVWGMARTLCPDRQRAAIAVAAVAVLAFAPGIAGMAGAILLGRDGFIPPPPFGDECATPPPAGPSYAPPPTPPSPSPLPPSPQTNADYHWGVAKSSIKLAVQLASAGKPPPTPALDAVFPDEEFGGD